MNCGWCEGELEDGMERWRVSGEPELFCTRDCAVEAAKDLLENAAEPVEVLLGIARAKYYDPYEMIEEVK